MKFSFDMPEVKKWAEFSSDYNPIHFDLEHARLAGQHSLILHGMLALMPVKNVVSKTTPENGWMMFRALFRTPISHGSLITFDAKPTESGLNFRVSAESGECEHFRGAYSKTSNPAAELYGLDIEFETALSNSHIQRFSEFYPDIRESWIALDSVVFSEFMRTKLSVVEGMVQTHMVRLYGDIPKKKVVVQLSHKVVFDAAFFNDGLVGAIDWNKISYAFSLPKVLASDNQVAGTVLLPVMSEGRLVMLLEIGLISKFDRKRLH